MNSQDKLGLTVCYRTDDEDDIGIYISEVRIRRFENEPLRITRIGVLLIFVLVWFLYLFTHPRPSSSRISSERHGTHAAFHHTSWNPIFTQRLSPNVGTLGKITLEKPQTNHKMESFTWSVCSPPREEQPPISQLQCSGRQNGLYVLKSLSCLPLTVYTVEFISIAHNLMWTYQSI